MNNQPPAPFPDPGFQIGSPMDTNAPAPAPKFRLKKFLFFLRKFWWIPLLTLVMALGWVLVNFRLSPPQFVSKASMLQTEKLELPQGANFSDDSDTFLGNLTQVLENPQLRELALARLAAAGTNNIVTGKDGNPIPVDIAVSAAPKSTVYNIQAISSNPGFTPLFLNALMDAYLDYRKNSRKEVSGDTLASISAQVDALEQQMKSDQAVLVQYEQTNNFVILEQENQVAGSYLAKLKEQLADYQLQSNLLNAVALEKSSPMLLGTTNVSTSLYDQLLGNNSSSPNSAIEDADQQIAALKFQRDKLSKYLRPDHPKIVHLNEQIAQAQNSADLYHKENQTDITTARQALKIRIVSVQQAINQWEATVDNDSARIAQAEGLKANIDRNQSLYNELLSLLHNVDITRNIDQETLVILQPATPSTRSYQSLKSNVSAAAFGGLAVGLGIVLLITIRDDRFTSLVEVTERLGDGVVGQVPEIPESMGKSPLALLENNDDHHMYVESYRNLRSALLFFSVNGARPKLILITSAVPNEGKSTIASNLACTLALGGARVLLMDADLRKGRLHDILGLPSKPGFSELLRQPDMPDNLIMQSTPLANLWFVPRGSGLRNPGDLFLTPACQSIMSRFREQFDYVIVDCCPVFAADDATTLAPKTDGVLFVVRSRFSRASIVKEALDLLYQRQANVLGMILNRTDATDRSYHYYKYSEYHSSDDPA